MKSLFSGSAVAAVLLLAGAGCGEADAPIASTPAGPAQALIALANGAGDSVPWANRVTFSIRGTEVRILEPLSAADQLSGCLPGSTEIEGHPCPVSVPSAIATAGKSVVVEDSFPGAVGCNSFTSPHVPASWSVAVIRPAPKNRDCFSDFAVTLWTNPSGQVAWVDLTLSGP